MSDDLRRAMQGAIDRVLAQDRNFDHIFDAVSAQPPRRRIAERICDALEQIADDTRKTRELLERLLREREA